MTAGGNTPKEELARWQAWAAQVLTDRGLDPAKWGDQVRRRMIERTISAAAEPEAACTCTITRYERQEDRACPAHFPTPIKTEAYNDSCYMAEQHAEALYFQAAELEAKAPICMAAGCESPLMSEAERINDYCTAHEWRDVPPSEVRR